MRNAGFGLIILLAVALAAALFFATGMGAGGVVEPAPVEEQPAVEHAQEVVDQLNKRLGQYDEP